MFLSYFFNDSFFVVILCFKLLGWLFTSIISLAYHTKLDIHVYENRYEQIKLSILVLIIVS